MTTSAPVAEPEVWTVPIDADRLRELLPHRWPFLYLDRVIELEAGQRAVGIKNVTVSEPHFAGHFPHESVTPGVLMIEALAQLAGIVAASRPRAESSGRCYLASVNRMRFHVPVRPGDQLVMTATAGTFRTGLVDVQVTGQVDRKAVIEGRLIIAY